ncbi:tetratricopeptide repeat protein [Yoonia sp. MH D7]
MRRPHFKYIVTALVMSLGAGMPVQAADLDDLYAELSQAAPEEQPRIADQIKTEWEKSGSASLDLLLRRGEDALEVGNVEAALDHFSALIDHAPDFSEAYNGRATAYFLLGMIGPALDDLRELLVQNPRHFAGMRGIGIILEDLGRPADALEVYRAVLEIYPDFQGVVETVDRLELELEGQAI